MDSEGSDGSDSESGGTLSNSNSANSDSESEEPLSDSNPADPEGLVHAAMSAMSAMRAMRASGRAELLEQPIRHETKSRTLWTKICMQAHMTTMLVMMTMSTNDDDDEVPIQCRLQGASKDHCHSIPRPIPTRNPSTFRDCQQHRLPRFGKNCAPKPFPMNFDSTSLVNAIWIPTRRRGLT